MPTLLEQLQSITGGSSVSVDIAGQAGQFTQIAQLVQQLASQPPGDFGGYLSQLQGLALPNVSLGGELGQSFGQLLPDLQGGLGGLLQPLLDSAGKIQQGVGGDLSGALGPLLEAIAKLRDLVASDWTCGLVPALAPPPVPEPPPPGPPPPGPPPAPSTPAPVLTPAQVTQAKAVLDTLPVDMSVEALLKWLHERVGTFRPGRYLYIRSIPVLDDLRDPLDTLVRWDGFTGVQLAQELAQTLNAMAAIIEANTADIAGGPFFPGTVQAIPAQAFATAGDALGGALDALLAAVQAQNAATIATQLTAAQSAATQVEAANVTLDAQQAALQQMEEMTRALPSALETTMCRLLVLSQPRATWGDLSKRFGTPTVLPPDAFAPLTDVFDRLQEFLDGVLDVVDIGAVTQPIAQALTQVTQAIQQLEQGIAQLTASARAAFQQAHDVLDALDLDAVLQQAQQALQGALQQVQQAIAQGLGPAATALGDALDAVDGALAGFDPEQLAQPVQQVMDAIKSVFEDAAVQQAIQSLQQLKEMANQLDELSFRPVSDTVIGGIGTVKSALEAIDAASLPSPGPELISEAMSVLPESLTPIIDPLTSNLDELIDQGPIPLLEGLRDLPKPIVEEMRNFSPRGLLEEPLGTPFKELREKLDEFQPTQWLDAAEQELDSLKQRLLQALDLNALLAPLAQAQQALLQELGHFRPGAVIEPLAQQLEQALQSLNVALPTTQLTQELDQVLGRIQSVVGTFDQVVDVVQAFTTKLQLLADPDAQLDQWLTEILAKLPADAPATLSAPLAALAQAVNNARATPLQTAYQTARQSLSDKLALAGSTALLARILQGRSRLTPALVSALPASQAKIDLQQFLTQFDPAGPTFSRGLRRLAGLHDALSAADQEMTTLFSDWDARYHRSDGVLAALVHQSVTVDELRGWVREAIDNQLGAPVVGFLKQLKLIGALLGTFGQGITGVLQAVKDKIDDLLAVPQALSQAAHELEQLQQQITNLDLEMFVREVDSLYEELLDKLRALDPGTMEQPLRHALETLLDDLTLDSVFTPGLRDQIEQSYATLVSKVDALDPELLVIKPLDDLYTQDVLPLVDALDVSEAVQKLIDRLDELPDELKEELGRVDEAYQDMLAAAPSGSPSSGGGSVSL
jgi:hypothetical protein